MNSREQFEAWFKSDFHPDKTGPYLKETLFFAWQAASKASEQQLAAVVAENAGLKKRTQQLIDVINKADNDYCMCGDAMKNHGHGGCGHPTGMFDYHYGKWLDSGSETPATDAAIAKIQAQGVEMFADMTDKVADEEEFYDNGESSDSLKYTAKQARLFAAQLRQGAAL